MTNISFDLLHEYDPGKPGITIPVELKSGQQSVKASAKFDTMYSFPRNALGRFGWMQQMKLGLIDYEGKLYMSRYGSET